MRIKIAAVVLLIAVRAVGYANALITTPLKGIPANVFSGEATAFQELAFLLGFSSHASFSGAFKRWTGKTPSETQRLS